MTVLDFATIKGKNNSRIPSPCPPSSGAPRHFCPMLAMSHRSCPRDFLASCSDERHATPVFDKRRPTRRPPILLSICPSEQKWVWGAMAQQHVFMKKKL